MKILAIGDVTSPRGVEHLKNNLWKIREANKIDLCVVNGENASFITGISAELADMLFRAGADVITGGNHTLRNKAAYTYLDDTREMLRPLNFGDGAPGHGSAIVDVMGYRALVLNAMGNVYIEPTLDSPFNYIERALKENAGKYDLAILDVHAEATGEKYAVAHAFDGKIDIVFGTHTHVQTADEQVLPNGTGFISDIGMCGESGGILGLDVKSTVERMRTHLPVKYTLASGNPVANGVIFTLDVSAHRVTKIERISF